MTPAELESSALPPEPTRWQNWKFLFKARCFQMRRLWRDFRAPVARFPQTSQLSDTHCTGHWSSDLWRDGDSVFERELQLGKVQNLRTAAQALHGLEMPAGAVWSFWRHVGRTSLRKGYARGRELREGCIIPQTGGGLCQLSGAIYNAALEAGLEVVERHAHSNSSIGSLARLGRDATVFWNYVDLRLRHAHPWRLEIELTRDQLHVRIRSLHRGQLAQAPVTVPAAGAPLNACSTCDLATCHRSLPLNRTLATDRAAALVDAWWPEWDEALRQQKSQDKLPLNLLLPLDGKKWGKTAYAWDLGMADTARTFPVITLRRAWATRRLRREGARRQRSLLEWDARLAAVYAQALSARHSHLVISQNLLPHLWLAGHLGGRTFDVLMQRLPMTALHARLDEATRRHPESGTSADFRASPSLVSAEASALAAARSWISPHLDILQLAGPQGRPLDWHLPSQERVPAPSASTRPFQIYFPASTLCRKGAYELRDTVKGLPATLLLGGGILEGADFWNGLSLQAAGPDALDRSHLVVLPAYIEHAPRTLLKALARGIPVIATPACGLPEQPGLSLVPAGDASSLRQAMHTVLQAEGFETLKHGPKTSVEHLGAMDP